MNVANSLFWTDRREAVCPLTRHTIFQSTSLDKLACVSDFLRSGLSTVTNSQYGVTGADALTVG